jgi:hypothetical protein
MMGKDELHDHLNSKAAEPKRFEVKDKTGIVFTLGKVASKFSSGKFGNWDSKSSTIDSSKA